jgi:uncharacterized RDD family membrane protein YckC
MSDDLGRFNPPRADAGGQPGSTAFTPPTSAYGSAPYVVPHGAGAAHRPAGWWARVGATILDAIVMVLAALVVGLPVAAAAGGDAGYAAGTLVYVAAVLFYAPVMLAAAGGQTLGKRAAGVAVINADGTSIGFGRAFVRETLIKLGFGIVWPVGLLDDLWPLWQRENRALHDLTIRTRVVSR